MAQVVARLLAERDSLERERDEAREQVRSLTVERDAARLPEAERADLWGMIADRDRRLSRAREALKPVREAFEALCNADVFPTDGGPESQTADQLGAGLAALRTWGRLRRGHHHARELRVIPASREVRHA